MLEKLKLNLRSKFFVGFLAVVFPPLLFTFVMVSIVVKRTVEPIAVSNLTAISQGVASELERTLERGVRDLNNLATNPVIQSVSSSPENKLRSMIRLQKLYPFFEDITFLDLDSHVLVSTNYAYRGEWKGKPWYWEAVGGKTVVSDAYPLVKPFKVVLSIAMPVEDEEGARRWVIVGQMNMERIWEIIEAVRIGRTGHLMLVTGAGKVIGHPNDDFLLKFMMPGPLLLSMEEKSSGSAMVENMMGEEEMAAFAGLRKDGDSSMPDWFVVASQSSEELFAGLRRTHLWTFISFAGGIVLFGLLGYKLSSTITGPIVRLEEHVHEIAASKDLSRLIDPPSDDELGALVASFNEMITGLRETTVSRDYINGIIRSMTDMLAVVDREGMLTLVNEAMLRALKFNEDELLGRKAEELFADEEAARWRNQWRSLAEGGRAILLDSACRTKDGFRIPVHVSGTVLRRAEGNRHEYVIIIHDVTEQRRSEESLKQKLIHIENLNDLMVERESRGIELKREINELLERLGKPPKYTV